MNQNDYELYLEVSDRLVEELPEGPDRWSGTAVRGNTLSKILISKDEWKLNYMYDKVSLELPYSFRNSLRANGGRLTFSKKNTEEDASNTQACTYSDTLDKFRDEIIKEYNAEELGTSRFRPSGALILGGSDSTSNFKAENDKKLRSLFRMTNLNGLANTWKQIAPLSPGLKSGIVYQNTMTIAFSCSARRRDVRNFRFGHNEAISRISKEAACASKDDKQNQLNFEIKGVKDAFENFYGQPKLDQNGDILVERKASLGGGDVRVDNMAWGLKKDSAPPSSVLELMVGNKEREMEYLRDDAP